MPADYDEMVVMQHETSAGAVKWEVRLPFDGWVATAEVRVNGAELVVKRLAIDPDLVPDVGRPLTPTNEGGITSATLRAVNLGAFLREARARIIEPGPLASESRRAGADIAATATLPRLGRPPQPDEYLRLIAETRLRCARLGIRNTRQWMVDEIGTDTPTGDARSETQVRDDVKRARVAGWLASVDHGQREALPGPRLRDVWRRDGVPTWWAGDTDPKGGR